MSGEHDKAPNHQFYRRDNMSDGSYNVRAVFRHPLESFNCLSRVSMCGKAEYHYIE